MKSVFKNIHPCKLCVEEIQYSPGDFVHCSLRERFKSRSKVKLHRIGPNVLNRKDAFSTFSTYSILLTSIWCRSDPNKSGCTYLQLWTVKRQKILNLKKMANFKWNFNGADSHIHGKFLIFLKMIPLMWSMTLFYQLKNWIRMHYFYSGNLMNETLYSVWSSSEKEISNPGGLFWSSKSLNYLIPDIWKNW